MALFCWLGVAAAPAQNVVYFGGIDSGVGPSDPRPNSDLGISLFDTAAMLLGNHVLRQLDFEANNLGLFLSLSPAETGIAGLSILGAGQSIGVDTEITNDSTQPFEGFNTTAGGSNFLKIEENQPGPGVEPPVGVTFEFATPVLAFGANITGADPAVSGAISAIFDNGQIHTIPLDGTVGGGAQFWGFTSDTPVSRITFLASPELGVGTDAIGVDDLRWVQTPEPSISLLLLFAGLILSGRRR